MIQNIAKIARILARRPSDRTIRITRIAFALVLGYALVSAHGHYTFLPASLGVYENMAQWSLLVLALPPFLLGTTSCCLLKMKYMRLSQLGYAVFLFWLGAWGMHTLTTNTVITVPPASVMSEESTLVSFDQAVTAETQKEVAKTEKNAGVWIVLLAWIPLLAGITGKLIPSSCIKYGEKITKIRV